MGRDLGSGKSRFVAAIATVIVVGALVVAASGRGAGAPSLCCFTNDRYTGTCTVVPGKDETCESILIYLNTPNSVGRTYCGGTMARGGWVQVDCDAGKSAAQESTASSTTSCGEGKAAQPLARAK